MSEEQKKPKAIAHVCGTGDRGGRELMPFLFRPNVARFAALKANGPFSVIFRGDRATVWNLGLLFTTDAAIQRVSVHHLEEM